MLTQFASRCHPQTTRRISHTFGISSLYCVCFFELFCIQQEGFSPVVGVQLCGRFSFVLFYLNGFVCVIWFGIICMCILYDFEANRIQ